jgi:hypothetical protein
VTRLLRPFAACLLMPGVAAACPYCASVNQGGASDYIAATALLLILPLALVGGLTLWIRRAERDAEASRS